MRNVLQEHLVVENAVKDARERVLFLRNTKHLEEDLICHCIFLSSDNQGNDRRVGRSSCGVESADSVGSIGTPFV